MCAGGNFDENLVYVNDIEVYRPFLVRAGQQEGLSFPNPDMIERIQFSPGGFEARYGDKMSSVLDITYKRPKTVRRQCHGQPARWGGPFGEHHAEQAVAASHRIPLPHQHARAERARHQRPIPSEIHGPAELLDLRPHGQVELGFLGLYSSNKIRSGSREPGNGIRQLQPSLRFTAFFEGQEVTRFETLFGALNLNVQANKNTRLKFTASAFNTVESERFDVLSEYYLDELERDPASSQYGEVKQNLGIGRSLEHARNDLDATVITFAHKGLHAIAAKLPAMGRGCAQRGDQR
jgi:hypothetical protein